MPSPRRFVFRPWVFAVLAALLLVTTLHRPRIRQAQHLTGIPEWSCDAPAVDASSPTGLAGGTRRLVGPIDDPRSLETIAQAQHLLAGGAWRVRTVESDNAPAGRTTHATLPARLWLAGLAWLDHIITGQPAGLAVERAAVFGDPLLHALIVLGAGLFAGWRLGGLAAGLVAVGVATWFPAAGQFIAGAPGAAGLAWGACLASALLLVAGWSDAARDGRRCRWFALAGACGGLGLWIDVATASPVIIATVAGAALAALGFARRRDGRHAPSTATSGHAPWRTWGVSGGLTTLVVWVIEYGAETVGTDVVALHPLLALAWLGAGDLLARLSRLAAGERVVSSAIDTVWAIASFLAVAALPVALALSTQDSLWTRDPLAGQLARGTDRPLGVWIAILPMVLVVLGAMRGFRGSDARADPLCAGVATLACAAVVCIAWACIQGRVWSAAYAVLLALAAALGAGTHGASRSRPRDLALVSAAGAAGMVGVALLWPARAEIDPARLPAARVTRLFERDLAHWLRQRAGAGPVVVLAPPATSEALAYYAGARGVCSLSPENKDGFAAAVRIVAATTPEEARALVERRGITHLVFPSWDTTLDRYAGFGLGGTVDEGTLERTFIVRLRRGSLPDWLRAVPQQLPRIGGLERQAVAVFEVVEEQEHAEALSRLAECYVELEEPGRAAALTEELQRYPSDLGARAALIHVAAARGDRAMLGRELDGVRALLASGADEYMSWDRRLSLAVVLAQAKQVDAARAQLQRCLAEADEVALRRATAGELFKLLTLAKRFQLTFADASLGELTMRLLPPEFRGKL